MKILVVGSGGREHALAWKLAQSERVQTIFVAPGNGGTATDIRLKNIDITDPSALADFVQQEQIELTVVGPEVPLAAGIVNIFRDRGLKIFGPSKEAAQLESSKTLLKRLCIVIRSQPPNIRLSLMFRQRTTTSQPKALLSSLRRMVSLRVKAL
jgi:phosphoribosylamine-glycine ligase